MEQLGLLPQCYPWAGCLAQVYEGNRGHGANLYDYLELAVMSKISCFFPASVIAEVFRSALP